MVTFDRECSSRDLTGNVHGPGESVSFIALVSHTKRDFLITINHQLRTRSRSVDERHLDKEELRPLSSLDSERYTRVIPGLWTVANYGQRNATDVHVAAPKPEDLTTTATRPQLSIPLSKYLVSSAPSLAEHQARRDRWSRRIYSNETMHHDESNPIVQVGRRDLAE